MLTEPKTGPNRQVAELATALDVTPAAIYRAIKHGHIRAIPVGAHKRLTQAAFEYHAENGYGPNVPPYGAETAA